ncbi:2-dehydropantoate 2-reductase [Erysipelothrix larvae]|uniref:2-dehydropantoate 2-reductase n=1 Tax=Erysipelothrix larvae TaxID=1514105 RepID=A0A0X8GZ73_9FIRM|nr:2-dehydropantoate 2-reductase [Erysipelothrix larvae]AMC93116.1 2-dehydropantoate 2-reductase [Erysipelothrix larvae]
MKILIAGSGAMGARFGYLLKESGNDVLFVDTWQDHIDAINKNGLQRIIDGVDIGPIHIPAVKPEDVVGHYDLVLLFVKSLQLDDMMQRITPSLSEDSRVLCLLNGLGNIEIVEKYVSRDRIYLGMTLWSSGLKGPGVLNAVGSGSIEMQQVNNLESDFDAKLLTTLNDAGLNAAYSKDVIQSIWHKVSLNCVLNTYCTLIDCNIGEYGAYEKHQELTDLILNEIIAVGKKEGIEVIYDIVANNIKGVFSPEKAGGHYPSLYQDIASGRRTEIDALNGAIVKLGEKHGVETPVCKAITLMIHSKENVNDLRNN